MDQEIIPLGSGQTVSKPRVKAIGIGGAGHNMLRECPFSKVALQTPRDNNIDPSIPTCPLEMDDIQYMYSMSPELVGSIEHKSLKKIGDVLKDAEVATIFSGLGGETGSGLTPMTAYGCKRTSCLSIASVAMPFSVEGASRKKLSSEALPNVIKSAHITISYPNDGLLKIAPDLPFKSALNVMNFFMTKPMSDISNVITEEDISIIKSNLSKTHMRIGIGRGAGTWGEETAVKEALTSPWFDFDMNLVEKALLIILAPRADEYTFKAVMKHLGPAVPNASVLYWIVPTDTDESEVTLLLSHP